MDARHRRRDADPELQSCTPAFSDLTRADNPRDRVAGLRSTLWVRFMAQLQGVYAEVENEDDGFMEL